MTCYFSSMHDTISSIRRSASRFFSGTLLSRISGMLRDMSMAYTFGVQPAVAAFMLAFRLAHLFRRLFGEGALQSAFIPEFETLRHQDRTTALTFFRDLAYSLSLLLVSLISLLCAGLGTVLYWGDLSPANREVIQLTLLMLPSLLFICLYGLNTGLLQCEKHYFTPAAAPIAFNVIWIAAVFALRGLPTQVAMPWLAAAIVAACFCQWFITIPSTYALLKAHRIRLTCFQFSPELSRLVTPLTLGILGVAATQVNVAMDSLFARYADPSGPALLWYAIRLEQLPLALFGVALAGALLPPLSRALKAQDWISYFHFLRYACITTCTFMLPITLAIVVMGDISIQLIYGYGDFDHAAVVATTQCLWAYGLGLLPAALVLIMAPACYAHSNYRSPAQASLLTMLLNALLNAWFILACGWGAISVALATSLSAWVNLFYLGRVLSGYNQKDAIMDKTMWQELAWSTLGSAAAFLATYAFRVYLQEIPLLAPSSGSTLDLLITLGLQATLFTTVYAGVRWSGALGVSEKC